MQNTFNFNRFSLLFKKHTAGNYKTYLMSTAVLAGMLLIFIGFSAYGTRRELSHNAQFVIFMNVYFLAGTIFTSTIFAELGDQKRAISALMLPVSHMEKYFVAWLYSLLIFPIIYIVCFYGIAGLVIEIKNSNSETKSSLLNVFNKEEKMWVVFPAYIFFHSICFLGAIFFKKLHFIKTVSVLFAAMIILYLINQPLLKIILGHDVAQSMPFTYTRIENVYARIESTALGSTITGVMMITTVLLLWVSAYFKLKEKEV